MCGWGGMHGWVGEWDVCDWGRGMCMFEGQTSIAGGGGVCMTGSMHAPILLASRWYASYWNAGMLYFNAKKNFFHI